MFQALMTDCYRECGIAKPLLIKTPEGVCLESEIFKWIELKIGPRPGFPCSSFVRSNLNADEAKMFDKYTLDYGVYEKKWKKLSLYDFLSESGYEIVPFVEVYQEYLEI